MDYKICKKCEQHLDISKFYKHSRGHLGVDSICKSCKKLSVASQNRIKVYNPESHRKAVKKYEQKIQNTEVGLRRNLARSLRKRLRAAISTGSAVSNLGCSVSDFKCYLESKFKSGMSWSNRSEWHIDHIIPLSRFDLSNPEELKKACHYSNLQPMWAFDNMSKGNR